MHTTKLYAVGMYCMAANGSGPISIEWTGHYYELRFSQMLQDSLDTVKDITKETQDFLKENNWMARSMTWW